MGTGRADGEGFEASRRWVLRAAAGLGAAAVTGLAPGTGATATRTGAGTGPFGPGTWNLNQGWKFGADDTGQLADVTLPHTVVPLSWRDWDPAAWEKTWLYRRDLRGAASPGTRVFLDFEGVMSATTVRCDGTVVGGRQGGYLPWSVELTRHLTTGAHTVDVLVDARWLQVPPSGGRAGASSVDYLQPGGIYRDVALRVVPQVFLSGLHARPVDVLHAGRKVEVTCEIDAGMPVPARASVEVSLRDGSRVLATATVPVPTGTSGTSSVTATLTGLPDVELWHPDHPRLYPVAAKLAVPGRPPHTLSTRIGFREARFTTDGFFLNGARYKIFGLNRHQLFPYTGMAMPARVQRRDAEILKHDLNVNMVRCSHYPQSSDFLDACDELGLLVWEETPGWQYLGDQAWQDLVLRDVRDMVVRDRNRPSVVIWGTRVNESANDPDLYRVTRAAADSLDGTRPTSGSMTQQSTAGWAQDVFAFDDYRHDDSGNATLLPPLPGVPYLVSEAVGALDGPHYYRWTDAGATLGRQALLHAQVHQIARADDHYAGLIAWCGFDYASMNGFQQNNVKSPGVVDGFRVPKPGAAIYRAQTDPAARVVIEPAFFWDFGPASPSDGPGRNTMIATNCDRLEIHVGGRHVATCHPDRKNFGHLRYPPVFADLTVPGSPATDRPELLIEGYLGNRKAAELRMSADTGRDTLQLAADDSAIRADGSDATRVVFRAVDRYGNHRPGVGGDLRLAVTGPAALIGPTTFPFGDAGGVGAVWLRSLPGRPGAVTLTAQHPTLGTARVNLTVQPAG